MLFLSDVLFDVLSHLDFLTRHASPHANPTVPRSLLFRARDMLMEMAGMRRASSLRRNRRKRPRENLPRNSGQVLASLRVSTWRGACGGADDRRRRAPPGQEDSGAGYRGRPGGTNIPAGSSGSRPRRRRPRANRRRDRRVVPDKYRCDPRSNHNCARCRRRRRRRWPRRGLKPQARRRPGTERKAWQHRTGGAAWKSPRIEAREIATWHAPQFRSLDIWGREFPNANHILRRASLPRGRTRFSEPGKDEYKPVTIQASDLASISPTPANAALFRRACTRVRAYSSG